MTSTTRLQLLTCLMVYVSSVHGIMVKFGTKGGPIEPPVPEPSLPPPQPYRAPAPVWEERSNDAPDPNAQWRPQPFKSQPRYTHIVYNVPTAPPLSLTNAQKFVNSYIPNRRTVQPIQAEPTQNYFTPAQFLSSQSLPGVGLRYFVPLYLNEQKIEKSKQDDSKLNRIETDQVDETSKYSASDSQWKYEKEAAKRTTRNTQEVETFPIYQWPIYIIPRHR